MLRNINKIVTQGRVVMGSPIIHKRVINYTSSLFSQADKWTVTSETDDKSFGIINKALKNENSETNLILLKKEYNKINSI